MPLPSSAGLAEGLVTLNDATLSVSGVAASAQSFTELREAFTNKVPSALALGPVDLLPARADPFVWSAAYDGTSVTFSGYVPNEVVHETLIATAKASLARVPVVDQLSVASGEPEGFAEAASFAVTALARLSDGGVMLDGLTLDIAGTARSVDDYEAVLDGIAGDLPEGLKIVANDIKPAMVSPYGWQGEKNGNAVVLSGYVPSLEGHNEIATLARAQFAGQLLTDNTRIAAGEPQMDWIGGVKFAMGVLAKLNRGKVILGDKTFSMEGEAASPAAFAEILAANEHTLPASLELARAEILPPRISPYRFVAENGPQGITLDGYAPSEADKQKILDTAQRKFGQVAIEDKLVYASGAPADYVDAVSAALEAMNRLGGARAEIVDTSFNLEGTAYYLAAADDIESAARIFAPRGLCTGLRDCAPPGRPAGRPAALPRPASARAAARPYRVQRQQGRNSRRQLWPSRSRRGDRRPLPRCHGRSGAHSDSDGSTAKNRDLTQARAEAIVDYLVDAGVQRERLTAVGHGEATPVADNDTRPARRPTGGSSSPSCARRHFPTPANFPMTAEMLYLIDVYWPFVLIALAVGILVWLAVPRSAERR